MNASDNASSSLIQNGDPDEANLRRYYEASKNPNVCRQLFSNYKRRLLQICAQQREVFLIVNPIFLVLVAMVSIQVVFSGFKKLDKGDHKFLELIEQGMIQFLYPVYLIIGMVLSSGLFINAVIADHFEGLRHLLNFAGMNPFAYVSGILLAEYTIYMLSTSCTLLLGLMINI